MYLGDTYGVDNGLYHRLVECGGGKGFRREYVVDQPRRGQTLGPALVGPRVPGDLFQGQPLLRRHNQLPLQQLLALCGEEVGDPVLAPEDPVSQLALG